MTTICVFKASSQECLIWRRSAYRDCSLVNRSKQREGLCWQLHLLCHSQSTGPVEDLRRHGSCGIVLKSSRGKHRGSHSERTCTVWLASHPVSRKDIIAGSSGQPATICTPAHMPNLAGTPTYVSRWSSEALRLILDWRT